MKSDKISINEKGELFSKALSMHDCSFVASFKNNTLILTFDNLEWYYDTPPITSWFNNYKKLTIKYHDIRSLRLTLKFGKKEKDFYETVAPLEGKELIMYKYSIDSFDAMILDFDVRIKNKLWGGEIKIYPKEIEYIWE